MIKAYFRCNGGDYFDSSSCPFDGWSSPELQEFLAACRTLTASGRPPSIEAFRSLGMSSAALQRVIVVEFGSQSAAFEALSPNIYIFEALSPNIYIKDGAERRLGRFGPELT
jgi:hypothetical protein